MNKIVLLNECIELAKRGLGRTSPNPMVGCIVYKDGKIIGRGYHQGSGKPHAEPNAIEDAERNGHDVAGSIIFCSLEPCCHKDKKTPPCTDLLIKKKVSKVICAALDPNPKVAGKGLEVLRENGIDCEGDILKEQENELNKVFRINMIEKRPYIHLKIAQTLDGKISDFESKSKWITDEAARVDSHFLRALYDGILVGANTIKQDNPSLNLRFGFEKDYQSPTPIILGRDKKALQGYKIFQNSETIFMSLAERSLKDIMRALYNEKKICSILVEGGSHIIGEFFKNFLFDELSIYIAPKIFGKGKSSFGSLELSVNEDSRIKLLSTEKIGEQIKLNYKIKNK